MVDKVDIEEEEKGEDKRDQHNHNIKTDPTKEEDQSINCNVNGDGVDEEDGGGVHSDSAVLRSMLTARSSVVGAHHISGPMVANNHISEELDVATAGGDGARGTREVARGGVLFVPGDSILRSSPGSNNMEEVSADVDVEATPVCPGEHMIDLLIVDLCT